MPGLDTELICLQIFEGWPVEEKMNSVQLQKLQETKFSSFLKNNNFLVLKLFTNAKNYLVRVYTSL